MGTVATLVDALAEADAAGLSAVLGNGVACDIGCWMEAMVAARKLETTGEMNGFLKPRHTLLTEALCVRDGALRVPARFHPTLDAQRIAECLVEQKCHGP